MKKKFILATAIVIVFLLSITINFLSKSNSKAQVLKSEVPVISTQQKGINEKLDVRLTCEKAKLDLPNVTKKINCTVHNNTKENITALVLIYDIALITDDSTREFFSSILTLDMLFHPDLINLRRHSFIKSNESSPITILPATFDPLLRVDNITVRIDYIEFEDSEYTIEENGRRGKVLLSDFRTGINVYRNWLIERAESEDTKNLTDLLKGDERADENTFSSLKGKQLEGVYAFRKYINRIYKTKGFLEAKKFLVSKEVKDEK